MTGKVIAAIDVGSHTVQMTVGEIRKNGKYKELEYFHKTTDLGHDSFKTGKISFESVDRLCDLLTVFARVLRDYDVVEYKAVTTSAIREAINRDYIIDQVKLRTGLDLEVVSNSEEQYLNHRSFKAGISDFDDFTREGVIMIVIGAGSIQITGYEQSGLTFTQNLKLGVLRLREIFGDLENQLLDYNTMLEEYIHANLEALDILQVRRNYQHLVIIGSGMRLIKQLLAVKEQTVNRQELVGFFGKIATTGTKKIQEEYHLSDEQASIILPSVVLIKKFFPTILSEQINIPDINLLDGVVETLQEKVYKKGKKKVYCDIEQNARAIAQNFYYNPKHQQKVADYADILFERTKKLHRLEEERVLLQVAIILQDIGKAVQFNGHSLYSYRIIRSLEVVGLSDKEMLVVASVAKYHTDQKPQLTDDVFRQLGERNRIKIAKLIALAGLANAMDKGHKQKFTIQSVKLRNKKLIIAVTCPAMLNTSLEEWSFRGKADFFKEVYGVMPILKIKKEYS